MASVLGWSFLLSPGPGYLNALLRHLPWWSGQFEGPVDIYTVPWIVIITGLALTSFIYLFVSAGFENINAELLEAAQVVRLDAGPGVFFRVTLPLLRPSLVYGGGVALLLGLGQFTAPLLLGAQQATSPCSRPTCTARPSRCPPQYDVAAALGSPLLVFGIVVIVLNKILLGDQSRFVTHGGKAFRQVEPELEARRDRARRLRPRSRRCCRSSALVVVALSPFWSGDDRRPAASPSTTSARSSHDSADHHRRSRRASSSR